MTEPNTHPSRILIIKPSALGDITLSLPALSSLRASRRRITWLVRREFAPLLGRRPDDVLIFDRRVWASGGGAKAFAALMRFSVTSAKAASIWY